MIDRPRLKGFYHWEQVGPDTVFLLAETGCNVLHGKMFCQVVPLLDGKNTADDIVDRLKGDLPAAEI